MTDVLSQGRPTERLGGEAIAWLTTIGAGGAPQSSPVWFEWDGSAIWLRSKDGPGKTANVRANPMVSLHLESDGRGGDIVTIEGRAEVAEVFPDDVRASYLAKYHDAILGALGTTPEQLEVDFPVTLRITPVRTRSW